ncbi:hypothetical protein D9613_001732 [Agrocybe pediades]|uniref:Uncharacterized protein n=1 Tax=Agrocybe pediades TaxID=84607 RepID=A0A8H4R8Z4_9AGAR|nr:hypothetical protein D9613_001732 [Agrocybe pediades]
MLKLAEAACAWLPHNSLNSSSTLSQLSLWPSKKNSAEYASTVLTQKQNLVVSFAPVSVKYVHVKCLERWRKTSASRSAFFACPQCKYQYRFARTRISGLAANQIVVGGLSGLLFTAIVMIASYITTFFLEPTHSNVFFFFWPFEVVDDLVRAAFRVLRDGELGIFVDDPAFMTGRAASSTPAAPPGIIKSFLRRFIIGLPLVGATSVVHMLLNAPIIGPVQWMSRWRGSRSRRNRNTQDLAALIIVGLLLIGTIRQDGHHCFPQQPASDSTFSF